VVGAAPSASHGLKERERDRARKTAGVLYHSARGEAHGIPARKVMGATDQVTSA
jgi:hypothetical protein